MKCRGLIWLVGIFSLIVLAGCGRSDRSPTASTTKLEDELSSGVIKGHLEFKLTRSPNSAPKFDSPRLEDVVIYARSIETADTYPGKVKNNGDYIIERLPGGKYNVIATTKNKIYGGIIEKEVDVTPGKTKEIEEVLILSSQGRISGQVVLIGPNGERLPETGFVEVFIPGTSFSCHTTRKGEFTFYYIPAGEYTVAATCEGYEDMVIDGIKVVLGGETQIGEILMYLRGPKPGYGSVFGVVTVSRDPTWLKTDRFPCSPPPNLTSMDEIMPPLPKPKPIQGARVSVYPSYPFDTLLEEDKPKKEKVRISSVVISTDLTRQSGDNSQPLFEAVTDENGKYRIEGIPTGDYNIAVSAKGFEMQMMAIIIKPDGELGVDFSLFPMLESAAIDGRVVEVKGEPVPGVEISLEILWGGNQLFTAVSDQRGDYRIEGIPSWPDGFKMPVDCIVPYAVLTASKQGYKSKEIEIFDPLKPGEERRINLQLGEASLESADIYGRVGKAPDIVYPPSQLPFEPLPSVLIEVIIGKTRLTALTDEKGYYRVVHIPILDQTKSANSYPPEDALIIVSKDGYEPQTYNIDPPLKPGEKRKMEFYLRPEQATGSVIGKVMAGRSPLEGVLVTAIPKIGIYSPLPSLSPKAKCVIKWSDITDEKGQYRIDNLPVNDYLIRAEAEGYGIQEKEVTIEGDKEVTVNFNFEPIELKLDLEVNTGLPSGVGLVLSVTNPASTSVTLFFSSGYTHDFSIYDASGKLVWEWSYGKFFIMITLPETFQPGETKVYKEIWDGRSNEGKVVPAGRYTVIGRLASKLAWETAPVEFEFKPDEGPQLEYSNSGCLKEGKKPGQGKDEIAAKVEGNDVYVSHRNASYNCCLEEIQVKLEQEGNQLKLIETEILKGGGCRCMCFYDVSAVISDLPAGDYIIKVLNEHQGLLGETKVTVP